VTSTAFIAWAGFALAGSRWVIDAVKWRQSRRVRFGNDLREHLTALKRYTGTDPKAPPSGSDLTVHAAELRALADRGLPQALSTKVTAAADAADAVVAADPGPRVFSLNEPWPDEWSAEDARLADARTVANAAADVAIRKLNRLERWTI
jgi:hypothetical protein